MNTRKILVIEDDEETRRFLKRSLKIEHYEVIEAVDGATGYEMVFSQKPDVMILDIDIPKINGLQLCSKLRDESVKIPIILLMGKQEMDSKSKGLGSGADDYLEKPFNVNELLHKVQNQIRYLDRAKIQAEELLQKRWEEINEGLQLISMTHRPFFHTPDIQGIRSAVHYMPMGRIGGDFYRIARMETGKIEILIGDSVGKGLSASFLMASTFAHLYRILKNENSPKEVFKKCNSTLRQDFRDLEQYVTAFLAVYDPASRIMKYSSAGHYPPVWIKASGKKHELLKGKGFYLGAFDDGKYEEQVLRMERGDRIFFYTDGLLDIRDSSGNKIKFSQFYNYILRNWKMPIDELSTLLIEKCREHTYKVADVKNDLTFFFVEF